MISVHPNLVAETKVTGKGFGKRIAYPDFSYFWRAEESGHPGCLMFETED
jgi:hypothetical protein